MKVVPQNVSLVDYMGSDLNVANVARVSFHKESDWEWVIDDDDDAVSNAKVWKDVDGVAYKGVLSERDTKLIKYLAKHNHWTPFGHCFMSFRVKCPIFVARQLGKHQVGLVWNEVSRRYVDEEPEFYLPDYWRGRAENVKQGSSDTTVSVEHTGSDYYENIPEDAVEIALEAYTRMLKLGVCPEQARMVLPQNTMTEFIWSGSLAAFARVANLRLDSHTQKETREIAQMISNLAAEHFPISWDVLVKKNNKE